jgi:hypothetical protein
MFANEARQERSGAFQDLKRMSKSEKEAQKPHHNNTKKMD